MNFYQILEVSSDATYEVIKQAYRKLAKKYHPDRNPDNKEAEKKFLEISKAYETLSDEVKRKKYDQKFFGQEKRDYSKENFEENHSFKEAFASSSVSNSFENFFGFQEDGKKIKKKENNISKGFEDYFMKNMKR